MTLAEFLAARLDEDEAAAKAVAGETAGDWRIDVEGNVQNEDTRGGGSAYVACGPWDGPVDEAAAAHIARHDPARVLREVAAKRAILAEHTPGYPTTYPKPSGQPTCSVCHAGGWDWEPEKWPCATVRALAAIWSDHPDYQQEWKP